MILKKNIVSKLFSYLSAKRKREYIFLLISITLNGFFEAFSVASVVPFLTLLTSPEIIFKFSIIQDLSRSFNIFYPTQLLLPAAIVFCFLIILTTCMRLFNIWFILYFTAKVEIELNNIIFKKVLYQSYEKYTKKSSSETISLLVDKITGAANGINAFLKIVAFSVIAVAITLSLIVLNWKITSFSLLFVTLYYLFTSKKVRNILVENGEKIHGLTTERIRVVQEGIGSFRDLKINNTQKIYLNIFNKNTVELRFTRLNSEIIRAFPRFIIEALALNMIIIMGYVLAGNTNDLSFITLLGAFAFGFQRLLPTIQQIYVSWSIFKSTTAECKSVLGQLSTDNFKIFQRSDKQKKISRFKYLELNNVTFNYALNNKSSKILSDINLRIFKGDCVGIFGKTGSGKSTLLDILMGLIKPDQGNIFFNKLNIYENDVVYDWREKIAHVPQNIFLKEGTIEENIVFADEKDSKDLLMLKNAARTAEIYDFIRNSKSGFKTIVGERGIRLSGGQRQRIAIARAIYRRKKILILDEATSALDENTEKLIINKIKNLYKDITIIMVTHRPKSLSNCNRVFKIDKGKLIEEL